MMYEEFTDRLRELHVPEKEWPSVDEYHSLIERVYNYHPRALCSVRQVEGRGNVCPLRNWYLLRNVGRCR